MPAYNTAAYNDNSTLANFKAWAQWISDSLAASGLVRTADTGQIDWATVAAPSGASQSMGYDIFRFADAHQATRPIFIKIEYGSAAAAARPSIWITLGTGSDGAGNITGVFQARLQIQTTANQTVTLHQCYIGAGADHIGIAMFTSSALTTTAFMFVLERQVNVDGTTNTDGFVSVTLSTTSITPRTYRSDGTTFSDGGAGGSGLNIPSPNAATAVRGVDIGVFPMFPTNPELLNPVYGIVGYIVADIATGTSFSATIYGAAHQYIALGHPSGVMPRTVGSNAPAMRYE